MPAGNAKFLMDSVFELAQRINRFRLADAEIGLFCAVVIITAGRSQLVFPYEQISYSPLFQTAPVCATLSSSAKCRRS